MFVIQEWLRSLACDDRLMIILAASRTDDLLKNLLQKVMVHEAGGNDSLFANDRPLGTFSSRIVLSFRLGLIDRDFESFLQSLRKLRNDAAHSSEHIDLSSSPHIDRIIHLQTLAATAPMWTIFEGEQINPKMEPRTSLFASITFAVLSAEMALLLAKPMVCDTTCGFHLVRIIGENGQ